MPDHHLTESTVAKIELTEEQADALEIAGSRLATTSVRPGSEDDPEERTVIQCHQLSDGRYRVRVAEAVGVIVLPGTQIVVHPKIPEAHFIHLLERCWAAPRLGTGQTRLSSAATLWDLVAAWFVTETERVLRRGLLSDYHETSDLLTSARGSIRPVETATAYYSGNLALACDYEEFGLDSPLNRVLRAAAERIVAVAAIDKDIRRRARRVLARFDDVGPLRQSDLRAVVDRRSGFYRDAVALAHQVLQATGRAVSAGSHLGWTFLVRTPDVVEGAIRRILAESFDDLPVLDARTGEQLRVTKTGIQLDGSSMTLNPDLVFGDAAVGDVKYKISEGEWVRADLNQTVTFAAGYRVGHGVVVTFGHGDVRPGTLEVGDIRLRLLTWDISPGVPPEEAAERLDHDLRAWFRAMDLVVA